MKKVMLAVTVLFFGANVFAGQIVPKIGLDLMQKGTIGTSVGDMDTELDNGISIGAEYLTMMNEQFTVGGGFEYQLKRKYSKIGTVNLSGTDYSQSYIPLYATAQYNIKTSSEKVAPFLKLNLGYNLYSVSDGLKAAAGDPTGGIYYGLGGGAVINKNINVSLLYSMFSSKLTQTGSETKVKNSQIGLSVGYLFTCPACK